MTLICHLNAGDMSLSMQSTFTITFRTLRFTTRRHGNVRKELRLTYHASDLSVTAKLFTSPTILNVCGTVNSQQAEKNARTWVSECLTVLKDGCAGILISSAFTVPEMWCLKRPSCHCAHTISAVLDTTTSHHDHAWPPQHTAICHRLQAMVIRSKTPSALTLLNLSKMFLTRNLMLPHDSQPAGFITMKPITRYSTLKTWISDCKNVPVSGFDLILTLIPCLAEERAMTPTTQTQSLLWEICLRRAHPYHPPRLAKAHPDPTGTHSSHTRTHTKKKEGPAKAAQPPPITLAGAIRHRAPSLIQKQMHAPGSRKEISQPLLNNFLIAVYSLAGARILAFSDLCCWRGAVTSSKTWDKPS